MTFLPIQLGVNNSCNIKFFKKIRKNYVSSL